MNGSELWSPQATPFPVDPVVVSCRAGVLSHSLLCLFHKHELAAFLLFYGVHPAGLAIGQRARTGQVERR